MREQFRPAVLFDRGESFLYPLTRYAANIPRQKLGQDAVDYVTLNGNVQSMTATTYGPNGKLRPIDVTGVYLFEGSANRTMISMLKYFPNPSNS
ncbi:hypothetical protein RMSM_07567 [Rhodopirellula maiorica SM1]|uniref:Uncharacterized protein n=1 Tax=Rhodopirellula maiorica SM1 TaxID=1265738 RepID=M5R7P3_9BACT|nr:hypothetical protein RMSM_07567 [Rhodopirellula maiorica SM1]